MSATTIVFVLADLFFLQANYFFIVNTRHEHHNGMGASISFDQPFAISNILFQVGICLLGYYPWYAALASFVILQMLSLVYKWKILDKVLDPFRIPFGSKK
jgi:hypothetical protein